MNEKKKALTKDLMNGYGGNAQGVQGSWAVRLESGAEDCLSCIHMESIPSRGTVFDGHKHHPSKLMKGAVHLGMIVMAKIYVDG